MKLDVFRSTARVFGLLAAALCVMWACSTPVKVEAEADLAGLRMRIKINSEGDPITEVSGALAPGKCLKITYSDAAGATLGTAVITVPGDAQIPAGAVRQSFDIVDCPEPPPALTGPGSRTASASPGQALPRWREIRTMPITLASAGGNFQPGVICHARVFCSPNHDPLQLLQPILLSGPGVAVPATIEILFLAEVTPMTNGAQIRVAARSPILDMKLAWNDVLDFADLATGVNAITTSLPNGWNVVDSVIPAQALRQNVGDWNGGRVKIRTLAHPAFSEYAQAFQTLAF